MSVCSCAPLLSHVHMCTRLCVCVCAHVCVCVCVCVLYPSFLLLTLNALPTFVHVHLCWKWRERCCEVCLCNYYGFIVLLVLYIFWGLYCFCFMRFKLTLGVSALQIFLYISVPLCGSQTESKIRHSIDLESFLMSSVRAHHKIEQEVGLPVLHIPTLLSISWSN